MKHSEEIEKCFARLDDIAREGDTIIETATIKKCEIGEREVNRLEVLSAMHSLWTNRLRDQCDAEGSVLNTFDTKLPKGVCIVCRGGENVLWLYGEVGVDFDAKDFQRAFRQLGYNDRVKLRIDSPGGFVQDAVAIRSLIQNHQGYSIAHIDSRALSAASAIAVACDRVEAAPGATFMIHYSRGELQGSSTASELESAAHRLRETDQSVLNFYLPRWKGSRASLVEALEAETWFSAEEAVEVGLADAISNHVPATAQHVAAKFGYRHTPSELTIAAKADSSSPRTLGHRLRLHRIYKID